MRYGGQKRLTDMWYNAGMKSQQITFRLAETTRAELDQAAAAHGIGLSTLVGSIVDAWVKSEKRRQVREDVARIMTSPTKGELTDDPADWCPAVADLEARERGR